MKRKNKYLPFFLSALMLLFSINTALSKEDGKKQIKKVTGAPNSTKLNINNISTYLRSNGDGDLDNNGQAGFVFPKGSGKTAVYESGFLWGAKINGIVSVGGAAYSQGLQPGRILSPGVPEDPNLPKNRIYRVRPDYASANLSGEAVDEGVSVSEVFDQYQTDWMEWPAEDGAPYTDVDSNGIYDPNTDIPGVPGASQTIYFVSNDLNPSLTQNLYGSQPMGVEMHATIWAYSQGGPLGNMYFRKYNIFNKSNDTFTDMYVSLFSDVDDGDAEDDFAGCDTSLSLGYVYNANAVDAVYQETVPPAVGFDFFQGPLINAPGDSAIFHGERLYDKKNLPMTAFYYFAKGDLAVTDPTTASYEGTLQFYNFMQGRIGKTGALFTTPPDQGSVPTTFVLAGDPVAGTGWLDGQLIQAGDRRIGVASGPFTMNPGDEQEIVIAQIAAIGSNNLGSVTLLKNYDKVAQDAYDNFFKIPQGAQQPRVSATPLDQAVVLSWGDEGSSRKTENYEERGYTFEGYNVYQLPSASGTKDQGTLLATYDLVNEITTIYGYVFDPRTGKDELVPVEFGTDAGIKRSIKIDKDVIRGEDLHNGSRYYFAVTSYSYNPDPLAVPNVIENPLAIITVVPASSNPGVRYTSEYGDSIPVVHSSGVSDGVVIPIIIDPTTVTGHQYQVIFDTAGGEKTWSLVDQTDNKVALANQNNFSGDTKYPIVDGIQVVVKSPDPEIKEAGNGMVEISYDGQPLTESQWDANGTPYSGNKVWHSLNSSGSYYVSGGGGDGDLDRLYRFIDFASPRDFEIRFTSAGGYGVYAFTDDKVAAVPFEIWDIGINTPDDPSDDRRMIPFINENDSTKSAWGWGTGVDSWDGETPISDWIYWMDPEGADGYDKFAQNAASVGAGGTYPAATDGSTDGYWADFHGDFIYPIGRLVFADYAATGTPPPAGTTIRIITTKPISIEDSYSFTVPEIENNNEVAKSDVQKINVFPNPYYGVNSEELNKYQRFVTFNHLPQEAKIRIYNLAGGLVRTINKSSDSQFERWDLANNNGLPVASGLYIAHIEMPGLGEKILKLAIVQEQQILDRF